MPCLNNYLQFIKRTVTITPADWDAETKLAAVQADWAVAGMSATFAPVESSMNVFTDIAVQGVYCTNILNGDLLFKSGSGATVNENITLNVTAYNDGKGIIVNAEIVGEGINGMSVTDNSFDFTTSDNGSTITNIKSVFKLVIPPYDDHGNEITAIQQSNNNSVVGELYLINNIKTVGNSAFYNSSNLKKVYIGKQLTLIGAASGGSIRSFGNCPNLSEVVFERERTELLVIRNFDSNDANALFYNSAIENLVIPENVQLIEKPFANCTKLKAVRYESSYGLGYPFRNCTALEELTFTQATPVTVGTPTQTFNSAHYIFVPYDSFTAYTTATNWTSYASYMYGIGKFTAGASLPSTTTDGGFGLVWYATKADLKASNNPITVAPSEFDNEYGEIYCAKAVAE